MSETQKLDEALRLLAARDATIARLEAEVRNFISERQELRSVLRVQQPQSEGTTTTDFDPQPSLVDAAKMLVAELAALRGAGTVSVKHNVRESPCPTCGFFVKQSISEPFVIEDDSPSPAASGSQCLCQTEQYTFGGPVRQWTEPTCPIHGTKQEPRP